MSGHGGSTKTVVISVCIGVLVLFTLMVIYGEIKQGNHEARIRELRAQGDRYTEEGDREVERIRRDGERFRSGQMGSAEREQYLKELGIVK